MLAENNTQNVGADTSWHMQLLKVSKMQSSPNSPLKPTSKSAVADTTATSNKTELNLPPQFSKTPHNQQLFGLANISATSIEVPNLQSKANNSNVKTETDMGLPPSVVLPNDNEEDQLFEHLPLQENSDDE